MPHPSMFAHTVYCVVTNSVTCACCTRSSLVVSYRIFSCGTHNINACTLYRISMTISSLAYVLVWMLHFCANDCDVIAVLLYDCKLAQCSVDLVFPLRLVTRGSRALLSDPLFCLVSLCKRPQTGKPFQEGKLTYRKCIVRFKGSVCYPCVTRVLPV